MAVSKLQERAANIAERFVQTIVLIDDEAYSLFKATDSGQMKKADLAISEPSLLPGDTSEPNSDRVHSPDSLPSVDVSEEKPFTTGFDDATPAEFSQGLNSRNIVANFAQLGLVCGIIEPNPDGSDLEGLLRAAKRSDVLIVDWVFNRDQGKIAKHIIKTVLEADMPERLRLIVVYTGDDGVGKIVEEIAAVALGTLTKAGNNVLSSDRTRIAVLQKAEGRRRNAVTVDELPNRVLTEFAALYSGLVALVAMEGLAELRNNTHHLLARLRSHLDPAYLTHRFLLPRPEDAQEFLTDLVGQEIAAMLHSYEIGSAAGLPAVEDWLEESGKNAPKHAAEFAKKIGYTGDLRRELLTLGVEEFLKQNVVDRNLHKRLERSLHRSGSKLFVDDKKKADDADQEFAHVSSMVSLYDGERAPRLTLGTVLLAETGEFLVCIQPLCDCVRVKEARKFPFLLGEKDRAPNLILRDGQTSIRLKVESKSAALVQHTFKPDGTADVIYGRKEGGKFTFESSDKRRFTWMGQFKFPQAQRLAQQFGSSLARVGLDESEWLRRFDRGAEVDDTEVPPAGSEPKVTEPK